MPTQEKRVFDMLARRWVYVKFWKHHLHEDSHILLESPSSFRYRP